MKREIQESIKYDANYYFFVGSAFLAPLGVTLFTLLTQTNFPKISTMQIVGQLASALIGLLIIKYGKHTLYQEEMRMLRRDVNAY